MPSSPRGTRQPVRRRAGRSGRPGGGGLRRDRGRGPVRRGRRHRKGLRPAAPGVGAEPVGDLLRGGPLLGLLRQQPEEVRVEGGGDVHTALPERNRRGVDMLVQRRGRRVGTERRVAEQQLVDDAAQRVHVGRGVGGAAQRPLGGQVEAGADDVAGRGQRGRGVVDELGDAEVADLDRTLRVQHQVARLDVAVDDALAVRGGQPGGGLAGDPGDLLGVDAFLGGQQVSEALPLDQLHHEEEPVLPRPEVEHGHQMRMAQPGGGLRLQPEAGGRRGVRLITQQQLHGHGTAQDLVRGAPHLAHAATTDGGYQSVPTSYQHLYTYLEWRPAPAVGLRGLLTPATPWAGETNNMIRISVRRAPHAPTAFCPDPVDGPAHRPPVSRWATPTGPRTPPAAASGAPPVHAAPRRSAS